MTYKGKYIPKNPQKYKGNPSQIIYRSLWERKFMVYCDRNDKVIEWGSEEVIVPYRSPWDGKIHRYFPDFIVKTSNNQKYMIEIKPYRQIDKPKMPKKKTKSYMRESLEYIKNKAKWSAAKSYCEDNGLTFKLITEKDLGKY